MNPAAFAVLAFMPCQSAVTSGLTEEKAALNEYVACGVNSLYVVCRLRSVNVSHSEIRELVGPSSENKTHSFRDLIKAASAVGLRGVALEAPVDRLAALPMPLIVQLRNPTLPNAPPHFLVVAKIDDSRVWLLDPPYSLTAVVRRSFDKAYSGNAIVFPVSDAQLASLPVTNPNRWPPWAPVTLLSLAVVISVITFAPGFARRAVIRARSRRVLFLLVPVVGLTLGWMVYSGFRSVPGAPIVEFDQDSVDLGELRAGENRVVIPISNHGTEVLRVSAVRSSCTCAVVSQPTDIPAGGRGNIQVELSVTPGNRSATLLVESNDPRGPQAVTLLWQGISTLSVTPSAFYCSGLLGGEPIERIVQVTYPGGQDSVPPELVRWEASSPHLIVSTGPPDSTAHRYTRAGLTTQIVGSMPVVLRVTPPASPGPIVATCFLHIKRGAETVTHAVVVSVDFSEPTQVEPFAFLFAAQNATQLIGQERIATVAPNLQLEQLGIRHSPSWLEALVARQSDGRHIVRLRVRSQPPSGGADVVELTGLPGTAVIRIPVRVMTSTSAEDR